MYTEAPFIPTVANSHERNFMDSVSDTFTTSWMQDVANNINTPQFEDDPNYDWTNDFGKLSPGYEDAFSQFAGARSAAEFDLIKSRMDEYRSARAGLHEDGFWTMLGAGAIVALADPTTYIPIPLAKGIGFAKGVLKTSTSFGALTLATEGYGASMNPNKTGVEIAAMAGGSVVLGGLLGGAIGHAGAGTVMGGPPVSGITHFANTYFGRHSQAEGIPFVKSVDIDGQIRDVEIASLNTGTFTSWSPAVPATATADAIPEKLIVDEAAIRASFANAPWTTGTLPLPGNAFINPNEWFSFNILKSMQEKINPRMANEAANDYDARMAREAYRYVSDAREPLSAIHPKLLQFMQPGSPMAKAVSLFGNDTYLMDSLLKLAGDHGVINLANRGGKENPDSAFLSAGRMMGNYAYNMSVEEQLQYAKYLSGGGASSSRVMRAAKNTIFNMPIAGRFLRNGKLDESGFRELVGVAIEHPGLQNYKGLDITPEMHAVADNHRAVLTQIDEYARKNGLYEDIVTTKNDINHLTGMISRTGEFLQRVDGWLSGTRMTKVRRESLTRTRVRVARELSDFENRLITAESRLAAQQSTPRAPTGAPSYFPHVYKLNVIRERRDEFETAVANIFAREGNPDPIAAAKEATRSILGEGAGVNTVGVSQASFLKHRAINGSVLELGDFIELDSQLVMRGYLQKVVPALELTRVFGDYRMSKHLDEMRNYLNTKLANEPDRLKAEKIYDDSLQLMEDMRDRVLGNYGVHDALEISKETARGLRNAASLTYMGQVIFSAFSDAGRVLGTMGPRNVFRGFASYLNHDLAGVKIQQRYAPMVGEALDIILGSQGQRFNGGTESLLRRDGNMVNRFLEGAQGPFYKANLLSPWTTSLKQFSSLVGGHVIIEDAVHMASRITKGLEPDEKIASRLASFGINRSDALLIAKMPFTKTDSGKLYLANISNWADKEGQIAKDKFLGALQGQIRQSVTTPGLLDRPSLMDGVIYKRSTRRNIEKQINIKRGELDDLRSELSALSSERNNAVAIAIPDINVKIDAVKEAMKNKRIEIGRIQGSQAAESRGGSPLLSLPMQFMAFPYALASKMMQSVATDRDKAAVTGMMALFGLAYLSNWARTPEFSWEKKSTEEKIYDAFSRAGIAGWMETPFRMADVVLDAGPRNFLGFGQPFGDRTAEKIGAVAGPGIGLAANMMDAMFNPDYGIDERYGILRRNVPFANYLLIKPLLKELGDSVINPIFGDGTPKVQSAYDFAEPTNMFQTIGGSIYDDAGDDLAVFPNDWNPDPTIIRASSKPKAPAAQAEREPLASPEEVANLKAAIFGLGTKAVFGTTNSYTPTGPMTPEQVARSRQQVHDAFFGLGTDAVFGTRPPKSPEGNPAAREQPTLAAPVAAPAAAPALPNLPVEDPPAPAAQIPMNMDTGMATPLEQIQATKPYVMATPPEQIEITKQVDLPSATAMPAPEGSPGRRDQAPFNLRQPEGDASRREQKPYSLLKRTTGPEGKPGARDQTPWDFKQEPKMESGTRNVVPTIAIVADSKPNGLVIKNPAGSIPPASFSIEGKVVTPFGKGEEGTFNIEAEIEIASGADIAISKPGVVRFVGREGDEYAPPVTQNIGDKTSQLVEFKRMLSGMGNVVVIDHGNDTMSIFTRVGEINVETGDMLEADQKIASAVNNEGDSTILGLAVQRAGKWVDPVKFFIKSAS